MIRAAVYLLSAVVLLSEASGAERITNFTSAKTVYDFEFQGDVLWVATSGGLVRHDRASGEVNIRPATGSFPDPAIRALTLDSKGNLWAGSGEGYLLMIGPNGQEYVSDAYVSSNWRLFDIAAVGHYLIIGSNRGVSLFDTEKKLAIQNAEKIGRFPSSQINVVSIFNNRLYIGGESGFAILKRPVSEIGKANFYDPDIWKIDTTTVSPVLSFLPDSGKLIPFSGYSERLYGFKMTTDKYNVTMHVETPFTFGMGSEVTALKAENATTCWIGTESDHYALWNGMDLLPASLPGPTFSSAHRVHVDRSGKLWVLPYGDPKGNPLHPAWWLGINTFDGEVWTNYSPSKIPEMGHMALSSDAFALEEAIDGSMWFGFTSGQVKSYDPGFNRWTHYCIFGKGGDGEGAFIKARGACPGLDWGKCDAIAQDSSGHMWISSWNNTHGQLLCYKPDPREDDNLTGRYRRFPPYGGSVDNTPYITAIAVDKRQNILYGTDNGVLRISRHEGNPIKNGIIPVKEFSNLQKIYDAVVLSDGTTLVVTVSGVHRFNPDSLTLNYVEMFGKSVSCLAVESEDVFWYSVSNEGLIRYNAKTEERTVFNRAHGLIYNQINDIFVDTRNGYVWIASDRGVSRLALGYTRNSSAQSEVFVFPNPFSRKRDEVIHFENIPFDGSLRIYSLNGSLVGVPTLKRKGEDGSYFEWKPSSKVAPGTYFYTVVSTERKKTGKIIFAP